MSQVDGNSAMAPNCWPHVMRALLVLLSGRKLPPALALMQESSFPPTVSDALQAAALPGARAQKE